MSLTALSGLHVLECAHYIAGPRCAQILADQGADVIKLEPLSGDPARHLPPKLDRWSLYFAAHNRGKRSVAVDLKRPEGRGILGRLIKWADIVVTNFTPSAAERLGLDLESASRLNPRIVVIRISAFGSTGPDRDQPGFDGQIQARSGLAHMIGPPDRPPTITSVPVTDYLAAVEGAFAALLGLQRRNLTGEGQEIDVSMLDATSTLLGFLYADVLVHGHEPKRTGSRSPFALTGAFEAEDGFVYISPMGSQAWTKLFELIGRPEWGGLDSPYSDVEARLRDRDVIEEAVSNWTRRLSRHRVQEILNEAGIASGPVNSVNEAVANPILSNRRMIEEVGLGNENARAPMPGIEVKVRGLDPPGMRVVPELGADTGVVLLQLGFTTAEIDGLRASGVVQ